jgi:hypothetical protein
MPSAARSEISVEERDRALQRARKLEALAAATTGPEHDTALRTAGEIRTKYGLPAHGADVGVAPSTGAESNVPIGEMVVETRPVIVGEEPRHAWCFVLCAGLAEAYGCLPIFDEHKNGDTSVRIVGTEEDRNKVWSAFGIEYPAIEKGKKLKSRASLIFSFNKTARDVMVEAWCVAEAVRAANKARESMPEDLRERKLVKAKATFAGAPGKAKKNVVKVGGKMGAADFFEEIVQRGMRGRR